MPGTRAGWDSILYRIYIVGGLVGIVAAVVGTVAVLDPQGRTMIPVYAGFACVTPWFAGILAYWWWQLLFKDYGSVRRLATQSPDGVPGIKALRSWSTLSEAMSIHGGDINEQIELEKAARRPMIEWYGWTNVLALYIVVSMWLYVLDILPDSYLLYVVMGVVGLIVIMLVRTYFLLGGATRAGEYAYVAPLGLAPVETPTVDFGMMTGSVPPPAAGATVLAGTRHGRPVHIVIDGQHTYTMVQAPVPRFTVESKQGKLVTAAGAPAAVTEVLKGLRKAKRWVDLELHADPEGILVRRTPGRHQNMWLYDLWLAEYLLDNLGGRSG